METVQYDYKQILQRIVAEIKSSRIQVARKITSATMELYWNIGKELSAQHLSKGYGAQVVEMLASDLQKEFPGTTGFSSRNLWEMKRFYERYCGESRKLQQSVAVTLGTQPVVNEQVQEPGRNILLRDKEHGTGLDKGCAAELYQSGRFLNKGGTTQIA